MDYDSIVAFVQEHFTDALVLVIGSGLSAAEGIPGMDALAKHLSSRADSLAGKDATLWNQVKKKLDNGVGLEAALLENPPTNNLEAWIAKETTELLVPKELEVVSAVLRGERTLRLTTFLNKILKPAAGLPILTPNYDRLIEVACEMAGFHVDTTALGLYAGAFDHHRSCMGSCRGISKRGKISVLDHFPRAIVLKPHGSFDWYQVGDNARRCSLELDADRLIITPGLNKYRAGYNAPFDKHRELANEHIKQATRLLIVGYGFNDDHLQIHLENKIKGGTPTLILNHSLNTKTRNLTKCSGRCVCLSKGQETTGVLMTTNGCETEQGGPELWDLAVLTKELLT